MNPHPLNWKRGVLITGLPEKFLYAISFTSLCSLFLLTWTYGVSLAPLCTLQLPGLCDFSWIRIIGQVLLLREAPQRYHCLAQHPTRAHMGVDNPTMKTRLWLTASSAREPEIEPDSGHTHCSLLIPSRGGVVFLSKVMDEEFKDKASKVVQVRKWAHQTQNPERPQS